MKNSFSDIVHNPLFLCGLFIATYLYFYLPYFIFCPLPDILPDSFGYFNYARLISEQGLPLPKQVIDVPVGYPFFIFFCKSFFSTTGSVIIAQNIVYALSCLFLIWQFSKIEKRVGVIAFLAMTLYTVSSFTMRMNTALLTESIYSSLLILLTGLIALASRWQTPASFFGVTLFILIPCLIRPNGIYLFFVPIAILVWFYFNSLPIKYYKNLLSALVLVLLSWAGINYATKGIFLPGDPYRLSAVYHTAKVLEENPAFVKQIDKTGESGKPENYLSLKAHLVTRALTIFSISKPSFYYLNIKARQEYIYRYDIFNDPNQRVYDRIPIDSVRPLKNYLFGEYQGQKARFANVPAINDIQSPAAKSNKWMYSTHWFYKLYTFIIWNRMWLIIFYGCFLYLLVKVGREKLKNSSSYFLLVMMLMHVISLLVIAIGHNGIQIRYSSVSEFLILLTSFLTIYSFFTPDQKIKPINA